MPRYIKLTHQMQKAKDFFVKQPSIIQGLSAKNCSVYIQVMWRFLR